VSAEHYPKGIGVGGIALVCMCGKPWPCPSAYEPTSDHSREGADDMEDETTPAQRSAAAWEDEANLQAQNSGYWQGRYALAASDAAFYRTLLFGVLCGIVYGYALAMVRSDA
jgi:hypothetical protein